MMTNFKPVFYRYTMGEEPKKYQFYNWYDCTNDLYWLDDNKISTIVSYPMDDKIQIVSYQKCPLDWNILQKIGAKIMFIEKPL